MVTKVLDWNDAWRKGGNHIKQKTKNWKRTTTLTTQQRQKRHFLNCSVRRATLEEIFLCVLYVYIFFSRLIVAFWNNLASRPSSTVIFVFVKRRAHTEAALPLHSFPLPPPPRSVYALSRLWSRASTPDMSSQHSRRDSGGSMEGSSSPASSSRISRGELGTLA